MSVSQAVIWLKHAVYSVLNQAEYQYKAWTRPSTQRLVVGTGLDLFRSKRALIAENALLRQQLGILQRHVRRPMLTQQD